MRVNVQEVIRELRNGAADESTTCRALIDKAAGALLDLAAELEEVKRERDEAVEDFIDYATSGITNRAPYCFNRTPDCVDSRGWCINSLCSGFCYKPNSSIKRGADNVDAER